jgi:CRP-like cAMP-binding protein
MPSTLRIVNPTPAFDLEEFLRSEGSGKRLVTYRPLETIFSQGVVSDSVMYLREGAVKLSVLSRSGREAVIAVLGSGAFFGESALAGRSVRPERAIAMTSSEVLIIPKPLMVRLLHQQRTLSNRFIGHMLARNIRVEEDLVDQLFNSSEQRLARALLLLARSAGAGKAHRVLPPISQQTLADMVGTTRSRVNAFMNKFKRLGFIEYDGDYIEIKDTIVGVLSDDERVERPPQKTG